MGYREYEPIAERFHVPIVITGFEPLDILEGVLMTVRQLEAGIAEVRESISRASLSGTETRSLRTWSTRSSKSATENGEASVPFP